MTRRQQVPPHYPWWLWLGSIVLVVGIVGVALQAAGNTVGVVSH